ncbi:MAG: hypothetical protein VYA30_01690 [Myxococcota bacterium]|nr:hypothetical protein [Myxococcota bacterium]
MRLNLNRSVFSVCLLGFLLSISVALCAPKKGTANTSKSQSEAVQRIDYYVGDLQDSSVDGKQLYGPRRIALLKRVISSQEGKITEYFVEALSRYTRTIKVVPGTSPSEYKVDPPIEAGQVQFTGTPWTSQSWQYTVDLFRAGSKNVSAELKKDQLTIVHKIFGPKGKVTGLRTVLLRATKPEAYMVKLRDWESKYGAPQIFR